MQTEQTRTRRRDDGVRHASQSSQVAVALASCACVRRGRECARRKGGGRARNARRRPVVFLAPRTESGSPSRPSAKPSVHSAGHKRVLWFSRGHGTRRVSERGGAGGDGGCGVKEYEGSQGCSSSYYTSSDRALLLCKGSFRRLSFFFFFCTRSSVLLRQSRSPTASARHRKVWIVRARASSAPVFDYRRNKRNDDGTNKLDRGSPTTHRNSVQWTCCPFSWCDRRAPSQHAKTLLDIKCVLVNGTRVWLPRQPRVVRGTSSVQRCT